MLNNLPAHKVDGWLLYVPPYSPDFNPIELAFSKLQTKIRQLQARTQEALEKAI